MSETRYKLHWITAIIEVLKTAKEAILPLIVLVFANGLNDVGLGNGIWIIYPSSFSVYSLSFFSSQELSSGNVSNTGSRMMNSESNMGCL